MIQTNDSLRLNKTEMTLQARKALQAIKLILGAQIVYDLVLLFLAFQTGAWQLYACAFVMALFAGASLVGVVFIRRGRIGLGVGALIWGLYIAVLGTTFFVAGVGLVAGGLGVILTLGIAGRTLQQKAGSRAITAGVIGGIGAVIIDRYMSLPYRLEFPALQTAILTIGGALFLIYLGLIVRQFPTYTLRTKIIVAFMVVSVLSVGTIALVTNLTTRSALTRDVGADLKNIAASRALAIGDLLARQVDVLHALSLQRVLAVQLDLFNNNAGYAGDSTDIQANLEALDQQWQTVPDDDLLVQSRLINALALELVKFQTAFPDHAEIFVTDQYGAVVGATQRTSDYYQADEPWWQAAYNNGQGAVYIGTPEFDESSATAGLKIAIPIYAADEKTVTGILRTTYRLEPLIGLLGSGNSHSDLFIANGNLLEPSTGNIIPVDQVTLGQFQTIETGDYAEFVFEGKPSLVSQALVSSITGETVVANLGWQVIAHLDREEALALVEAQQNNILVSALIILGVVAAAAVGMAQLLTEPITRLTEVAHQITTGNLTAQAQVEAGDEIGLLARTFNIMTKQLRQTIDTLETQVSDRTQQLEAMVKVSQRLTGILDLSDLLRQVVNLTKETFGYYHVHIYLMDDRRETLLMAEGYGEAGAEMKVKGHNISIAASKSLVAQAAREGRVISVLDVQTDPNWLPNPLLPETRSEMAVPISLGSQVVGVLDVQSERANGLGQEDEATLQALANQVAVAVRNARLFTETQDALYEAQRLQQLYTGQTWEKLLASRSTNYEFRQPAMPPLKEVSTPEAVAALKQKQTVELRLPNLAQATEGYRGGSPEVQMPTALATPLKLRDQIIGVLGIHSDDLNRQWTADEIALIEAVSEQMSLAIENARLFEESQRNAWRDQIISESTAKVWSSAEIEEVMRTAVAQLGEKLRASEVVIRLGTEEELVNS